MVSKLESLEILDLSLNNFGGQVDKFDALSTMKNLTVVNLSNNKLLSLGGENGVGSTFEKLRILDLSSCNLRRFPSFLRSAKSLSQLDLSNNKIQGSIFKWETQGWEQLSDLDLSHNLLTSIEQFPGKNLASIDLHSNLLQGPLPTPPTSVREFLISENKLTGEITSSIYYKHPSIHQSCSNLVYRRHCQWSAVDDYKNFVQKYLQKTRKFPNSSQQDLLLEMQQDENVNAGYSTSNIEAHRLRLGDSQAAVRKKHA
ncbi:hypothetical protein V6N13_085325 [Hibiscus sabdariffa]